jgi:N-acetyl-alpha-D-muramate 1-phosphate uridylyltransferase
VSGGGGEAELPAVCILAGGVGSRLGDRVRDTPKPLLEVAGEPFLVHQLRLLAANGGREVVLCVGYLGEQIEARIGEQAFGMRVRYSYDAPGSQGTLAAIRGALWALGEHFLVLYGDTYLRIDYRGAALAWRASGLPAMMTVLHNEGRWDTSNASFDGKRVTAYAKRRPLAGMEWIDYGLGGLSTAALARADRDTTDLSELYTVLAACGELFGFAATARFYEIGTPAALTETDAFLRASAVTRPDQA